MTPEQSVTVRVADALEAVRIPYLLSGSFASNYYGIPRSTKDADFVLQTQAGVDSGFAQRLGPEFELNPQLTFETVTNTTKQLIRQKGSAFKIELFLLSQDPHDQARFSRKRSVPLFGRQLWFPSPEDVVVT